jgi:hypothetical protein
MRGSRGAEVVVVVWEVGSSSLSGAGTIALVLAIRTVNLKCCDCCAEQKASKDFSSFLKTQNLADVES